MTAEAWAGVRSPSRRWRRTVVAAACTGLLAASGSVSASWTATTTSSGNRVATGTVQLTDEDGGGARLLSVARDGSMRPGQSESRCVRVRYGGSLPADLRLFLQQGGAGGAAFDVTVERGDGLTREYPRCNGFTAASTAWATGRLDTFPSTWESGVPGLSGGATASPGSTVVYRVTLTARDDSTPDARRTPVGTGPLLLVVEARST